MGITISDKKEEIPVILADNGISWQASGKVDSFQPLDKVKRSCSPSGMILDFPLFDKLKMS